MSDQRTISVSTTAAKVFELVSKHPDDERQRIIAALGVLFPIMQPYQYQGEVMPGGSDFPEPARR